MDFELKEPSSSLSSSSPSIAHEPPKGNSLREYLVPLFATRLNILGPIPTENSFITTPHFFATIKCPNSCINTNTPKIIKAIIILINVCIFLTTYSQ